MPPKEVNSQKLYVLLYPKRNTTYEVSKKIYGHGQSQKLISPARKLHKKGYLDYFGETAKGGAIYRSTPKLIVERINKMLPKNKSLNKSETNRLWKILDSKEFRNTVNHAIQKIDFKKYPVDEMTIITIIDSLVTYGYMSKKSLNNIGDSTFNKEMAKHKEKISELSEIAKEKILQGNPDLESNFELQDLQWIFEMPKSLMEKLSGLTHIGKVIKSVWQFENIKQDMLSKLTL